VREVKALIKDGFQPIILPFRRYGGLRGEAPARSASW
jgi:hypothetical protein